MKSKPVYLGSRGNSQLSFWFIIWASMDGAHLFELVVNTQGAKGNCQFNWLLFSGWLSWGEPCGKNLVLAVMPVSFKSGAKHSPPFLSARRPFGQKSKVLRVRGYLHVQLWNQSRFTWEAEATHNYHLVHSLSFHGQCSYIRVQWVSNTCELLRARTMVDCTRRMHPAATIWN